VEFRAVVIGDDIGRIRPVLEVLSRRGIEGTMESDPRSVLETCTVNPPDLVIVGSSSEAMDGLDFLTRLVKTAWSTSAILVTDAHEEAVHQMTEGLGILGHIKDFDDVENLERLLDRFLDIMRRSG
jgi:PleD family two-component response regulator